ncbi:hypothetical protein HPB50_021278 [Hyalomma asiaticum]|uniref:Uncharacterized protein n=1 Tax=Hyalomma asiaticum TaxID=266040 RepID=A0ACB7S359_HYAAI|nr:hypothetical protein HPB50_021278 [Hyalomma asiaticum]
MASGEICQGVITINPDETPPRIKSELKWSQGTILGVRTLGNSTAAVVTCSGGPALHLLLQCRGVHTPLQKDHPRLYSLRHHWSSTIGLPATHSRSLYPLWHSSPSDCARPSST